MDNDIKNIDAAMKSSSLPAMTVYRGIYDPEMTENPKSFVGSTIKDKAYVSTSEGKDQARQFASYYAKNMDAHREPGEPKTIGWVLLNIQVPEGTKGIAIGREGLAKEKIEKEVLLNRGMGFKITGIAEKVGKKGVIYNAKVV